MTDAVIAVTAMSVMLCLLTQETPAGLWHLVRDYRSSRA